jgi:hypothetical protein
MNMSNSIFRAFLQCPARALAMHKGRILGTDDKPEWTEPTSRAMACGTLLDRIVLSGYAACLKPEMAALSAICASSYGDGLQAVEHLTTKKGEWNSYAQVTICAANRLLADSVAAELLENASMHVGVNVELTPLWTWRGEIDLIARHRDGGPIIIDLKHPGKIEDGWLVCGGKNVKAPWYDVWGYWFQLAGYQYGVEKQMGVRSDAIRRGILYATNSEPSAVGYVPIADCTELWLRVLFGRTFTSGSGMLDKIAAIVQGHVEAPACGRCDYCASQSLVTVSDGDAPGPVVGDEYGVTENVEQA